MSTPQTSKKEISEIIKQIGDLPSLPDVVTKIVENLGKNDSSAAEIAELISYDPGLTTKCLRMVNSAAYGFQRQISSVQHAIMILGFSTVRGVVLSASIYKMFSDNKSNGLSPAEFWRHSMATAIGSRVLAKRFAINYADDAFSAGLLHDIGKMIMDYYFNQEYRAVLGTAQRNKISYHGPMFLQTEMDLFGVSHAELGYYAALKWKLPITFTEAIRYHHRPEMAMNAKQLVYVVALANAFSHLMQLNHGVFNMEFMPRDVLDFFGFSPKDPEPVIALYESFCSEIDSVEDLLSSLST